jgi:hypothetical protein
MWLDRLVQDWPQSVAVQALGQAVCLTSSAQVPDCSVALLVWKELPLLVVSVAVLTHCLGAAQHLHSARLKPSWALPE